jgi:hypothetical protein
LKRNRSERVACNRSGTMLYFIRHVHQKFLYFRICKL